MSSVKLLLSNLKVIPEITTHPAIIMRTAVLFQLIDINTIGDATRGKPRNKHLFFYLDKLHKDLERNAQRLLYRAIISYNRHNKI